MTSEDSKPGQAWGEEADVAFSPSSDTEAEVPVESGDAVPAFETVGVYTLEEAEDIEPTVEAAPVEPIWLRVRRALFGGYRPDEAAFGGRERQLSEAIEAAPEAPTNYVLRGELYLKAGLFRQARDDFQTAAELADALFDRSDWGLIAQTTRDRALIGLGKAEQKLLL